MSDNVETTYLKYLLSSSIIIRKTNKRKSRYINGRGQRGSGVAALNI